MIDVRIVRELYRYNTWANGRVFAAASSLATEEFTRDLGSSYLSVRDTLLHIVWAEWIWLQRWNGVSPQDVFHPADFPSLDAVRARWSEVNIGQRVFLDVLTNARLLAVVRYVNLERETWQYPLWRQMYHVVNHSTYHRGQLTTMLRHLQAVPVPTDFLVFHDELESHSE
jgi:uncharacterized damage-inducible protein DinB